MIPTPRLLCRGPRTVGSHNSSNRLARCPSELLPTKGLIAMSQQGQLIRLKKNGRDGEPWSCG
jgi:hypothetical protein